MKHPNQMTVAEREAEQVRLIQEALKKIRKSK